VKHYTRAAGELATSVINNTGVIEARTLSNVNGVIRLDGGNEGTVLVSGTLDASGRNPFETGGRIEVLGQFVGLSGAAKLDASGDAGGGTVLVGGDYLGNNPGIQNAFRTYVGKDVQINANAITNGDGGRVIVWADDVTRYYGNISTKGGAVSGNGGFAEVSGKGSLVFEGTADLSAPHGAVGTLLLDPKNITVSSADPGSATSQTTAAALDQFSDNSAQTSWITPANLVTLLNAANVTLQANNDLTFTDAVTAGSGTSFLTLHAGRSMLINANISLRGEFRATLNDAGATAGDRDSGAAAFTMAAGTTISTATNNNNITITMATGPGGKDSGDITLANLNAGAGHVEVNNLGVTPGSDILRASETQLITAASAAFNVSNSANTGGAIGASGSPIRVTVTNLEARSQGGGAFFNSPAQGVTIGGANLGSLTGISTVSGGNIEVVAAAGNITLIEAISAAGSISITSGNGNISLNANLTSTLAGAAILAKASGNITSTASRSFQTNNGDLILWSDSDATGGGHIALGNSNTLNSVNGLTASNLSGGGRIVLAGGADGNSDGVPDGSALSTTVHGISLGTTNASSTTLRSGGGDITVRGSTTTTSSTGDVVFHGVNVWGAATIDAGQGAISITGESLDSYGVEFSRGSSAATTITSAKTSGSAIAITGITTAAQAHGLVFDNDAVENILATGGGDIALNGTATGNDYGIFLQATNVLASTGSITLNGGSGGVYVASASTLGSKSGSSITSSSSDITVTGNRVAAASNGSFQVNTTGAFTYEPFNSAWNSAVVGGTLNVVGTLSGVNFVGGSDVPWLTLGSISTLGGLTFGKSGNTSGIAIDSALSVAGPINIYGGNIAVNAALSAAGNILLQGDIGSFLTQNSIGVNVAAAVTTSSNGNITINGRGGSGTGYSFTHGVQIANLVSAGGTGAVNITGYGGLAVNGTTAQDHGIVITTASGQVKSSGGNVTLAGFAGGAGTGGANQGLAIVNGAEVSAAGAGSVSLTGTGGVTAATGNLGVIILNGIKIFTAGGAIGITGNAGTAGGFNNYGVIMQSSTIGSASSGAITLNGSGSGTGTGSEGIDLSSTMVLGAAGYAGNMTLNANSISVAATTVTSTGALTVQPIGTSFSSALTWPLSGLTLTSGLTGLTLGKAGNTANITVASAQTVVGPINIYGGNIALNAALTTTGSANTVTVTASGDITPGGNITAPGGISLLAKGSIRNAAGYTFTSTNTPILFASDTDLSGGGQIWLQGLSTFNSAGGNVTLAGGSLTGSGYAQGYIDGNAEGLRFTGLTINSGGGNVALRGKSFAGAVSNGFDAWGVAAWGGNLDINSGAGTVLIDGIGQSTNGFNTGVMVSGNTIITSSNTTASAITITGNASAASGLTDNNGPVGIDLSGTANSITATGVGGGITMTGTRNSTSTFDMIFRGGNILANGGAINIGSTGTGGTLFTDNSPTIGGKAATSVPTSSSPVNITFDNYNFGGEDVGIATTGAFTWQSLSTSFGAAVSASFFNFSGATLGGLTIGKAGNTANIDINSAQTVAGPISIYGGNIALNANLTTTAAGAAILAKASGAITQAANVSITTNGGNVTGWANATASNGVGGIFLNPGASISSGGGHIVLAGGLDDNADGVPDGFAWGNTNTGMGAVAFGPSGGSGTVVTLNSSGGDITVRGQTAGANLQPGISSQSRLKIDAGAGRVSMTGQSTSGHGIELAVSVAPDLAIRSSYSGNAGAAISLVGSTTAAGKVGLMPGLQTGGGVLIQAEGTAGITLSGTSPHEGFVLGTGTRQIVAASGGISILGTGTTSGLKLLGATAIGSASSGSAVQGITPLAGLSASDVSLLGNTLAWSGSNAVVSTSGNVVIESPAANASFDAAVSTSGLAINNASSIRIGKTTNTRDVTVANALSAAGPINIYGGNIAINANLTSTLANAAILAKASGNITGAASTAVQTNGGAITLWSDSDVSGQGFISLGAGFSLDARTQVQRTANDTSTTATGGGGVTLSGDLVIDGTSVAGLTVYSGGGDVLFGGLVNSGTAVSPLTVNAGAGAVTFNAAVGATKELANLTVSAGGANLAANVTTNGAQLYNAPVTLMNDVAVTATNVTFNGTVDSDSASTPRQLSAFIRPGTQYYWVDWTSWNAATNTATGTITTATGTVTVTYTNPQGIAGIQISGGTNYWTSTTSVSPCQHAGGQCPRYHRHYSVAIPGFANPEF